MFSLGIIFYHLLFGRFPLDKPKSQIALLNFYDDNLKGEKKLIFPENNFTPEVLDLIQSMIRYEEADRIEWYAFFNH